MHDRLKYYNNLCDTANEIQRLKNELYLEFEPRIKFVLTLICKVAFNLELKWHSDDFVENCFCDDRKEALIGYTNYLLYGPLEEDFYKIFEYQIRYQNREYDLLYSFPFDWLYLSSEEIEKFILAGKIYG